MDVPAPLQRHELRFRVRYAETDQMGFVHHANYLVYFEMGRIELLRASGLDYRDFEREGSYLVVVDMKVRYRLPARYDDELCLVTSVARTTPVRIEHRYELMREDKVLTEGSSTLACVDPSGKLKGIPDILLRDREG